MATVAEINALCHETYMPYLNVVFGTEDIGTKLLMSKGKKISGGPMVRQTSIYQYTKGGTFGRGTVFDTSGEENAAGFGLSWRYYYFPATIYIQDEVENAGPDQIHDILNVRLTAARRGAQEMLANDLFTGLGIDTSQKINCLDHALNDGTTLFGTNATYAGVDRSAAANAWFRGAPPVDGGGNALTIADMNNLQFSTVDGGLACDLFITGPLGVMSYMNLEWAKQQYVNVGVDTPLTAGFKLKVFHNGVPMVADNHCTFGATAANNRIYAINTDPAYFNFFVHNVHNFKMRPWMEPYDQGAKTTQIILACNLLVGDPGRHCILHNVATA